MAESGYGKIVKIQYAASGLNTIITQQKAYNTHAQKMGIVTTRLNSQGKVLSSTWKAQTGALSKMTKQLIGLVAVTVIVHKAFETIKKSISEGIEKFREFEYRMAEVSTILGDVGMKRLPALERGVVALSKRFGQATSDLSKGLYDILSAAFSAEDALVLLNVATQASIAGISDVRTSVDIFTTVLNTYGKSVHQAYTVSDQLFQSVVRGKFQFEDLESALGYVVPIAAQAGIEFKELMAALSTTTRHGLHLDMTARGLALAIQNIINPTEGAQKAAEKYGIDMSALGLRTKGLTGWFEELHDATKVYGKTIIAELIPNMRSLRVAMVLAGEEGIEGLIEDFGLLEAAGGRTEEALNKVMNTMQFEARQLQQEIEDIERGYGEWWSGIDIWWKRTIIGIAQHFDYLKGAKQAWQQANPFAPDDTQVGQARQYIALMEQQGHVLDKLGSIQDKTSDEYRFYEYVLEQLQVRIDSIQGSYSRLIAEIDDLVEEQDNLVTSALQIKVAMQEAEAEIENIQNVQLPLLKAQRDYARVNQEVKMGLADTSYEFKYLSEEMIGHINVLREHERIQKKARQEQDRYTISIRENNLAIMKLQLAGMKRRHGLRRSEERDIKKLQIANLEARIAMEENTEHVSIEQYEAYNKAKEAIDLYMARLQNTIFELQDTYDEEIKALEDHLFHKQQKYLEDEAAYRANLQRQYVVSVSHYAKLSRLWRAGIVEERPQLPTIRGGRFSAEVVRENILNFLRGLKGFQGGSYFVPETRPYMLHKGETVTPAGRQGGNMIVRVEPITVNAVFTDKSSVRNTGRIIGQAIAAGFISGVNSEFEIG